MLRETGYAKVNLALHVRARRPDGYHELESLFVFCADGDRLSAEPREDGAVTLAVEGPFAEELGAGDDNLVLRAARALQMAGGAGQGASLTLEKNLPIASGIGGGSADAAAALRILTRLWSVESQEIDLFDIALGLGADVPACLGSQTVFGSGAGERLRPVDVDLEGWPILLVNPLVACPTGPVFRAWDGVDRGALDPERWQDARNDLQAAAISLVPEIAAVLDALSALPHVRHVRMSGSGATCFALFDFEGYCAAGEAFIRDAHPDWWVIGSTLR